MVEGRSNGRLVSVNSMEFRWVYEYEEGYKIDNDGNPGGGERDSIMHDSDDEDCTEKKLIRTGPRIDSFDVEALEVPDAQRNDYDVDGNATYFLNQISFQE